MQYITRADSYRSISMIHMKGQMLLAIVRGVPEEGTASPDFRVLLRFVVSSDFQKFYVTNSYHQ